MPPAKRRRNEPPPPPVIVKKVIVADGGGHHGGAWKVAYADFVTAMMAFFLLLWLLGATQEDQRKGLADYFTPTLVKLREESAGANGMLGGDWIVAGDNYPNRLGLTGTLAGLGSANPCTPENYGTGERMTYGGRALVCVRAGRSAGDILVAVEADGISGDEVVLRCGPPSRA